MTEEETAEMGRFEALGVITGKGIPDKGRVKDLFQKLEKAFSGYTDKETIVGIMKEYLPGFEHIETGKSLDSKM